MVNVKLFKLLIRLLIQHLILLAFFALYHSKLDNFWLGRQFVVLEDIVTTVFSDML